MPNLGAADGTRVWMMYAVDRSSSLARTNGLAALCAASGSHPRAEQRGSKVVGALEVLYKYVRRRCSSELG